MHLTQQQIDNINQKINNINNIIQHFENAIDNLEDKKLEQINFYDSSITSATNRKNSYLSYITVLINTQIDSVNNYFDNKILEVENRMAEEIARLAIVCGIMQEKFNKSIEPLNLKLTSNQSLLTDYKTQYANATNDVDRRYWSYQIGKVEQTITTVKKQIADATGFFQKRYSVCVGGPQKIKDRYINALNSQRSKAIAAVNSKFAISINAINRKYNAIISSLSSRKQSILNQYNASITRYNNLIIYLINQKQKLITELNS